MVSYHRQHMDIGISTARETNKELIGRVSNYYEIVKYTTPLD